MSKRQWQGEQGQANCHYRSGNKHKNLYLVLDDWHRGFTIRKLDADNPDLSSPPVVRLVSPQYNHAMGFAVLGSNIIATSNQYAATVVFDTETAALTMGCPLPDSLYNTVNYFLSAEEALFAFSYDFMVHPHSFELLTTTTKDDMNSLCPSTDWSWKSVPGPFTKDERIQSYALHPDGHTVIVSAYIGRVRGGGTFSFDTKSREWRRLGDWMLPFNLEAYFDAELDAWVGLHRDGYICSCQVPSLGGSNSTVQRPDWKMAKEHQMWSPPHQLAKGRGATLTYMGNSRFLLVDCVAADGLEFHDAFGYTCGCVLSMTTFHLRYDHEGNIRIKDRNTTSCRVSKQLSSFSPVAFWM
ncbi:hypothetical protein ACQ4PT_039684 [Festuca glaucescens]